VKNIATTLEQADGVLPPPSVAVLIPCFNEEVAIGKVVSDFRAVLPEAQIYVYDNNSTDRTLAVAAAAGAICRTEPLQGKGNVVRRMFADVDADVYVLVDGDDTYHAGSAHHLIAPVWQDRIDMVNAIRRADVQDAYRTGHRFGNRILTGVIALMFGNRCKDVLSGYRAMSRRFVKSFPALSEGFEIETELTVHALELRLPILEIETPYKERPVGSYSKLKTYADGFRILQSILVLIKEERPFQFFSILSGLCLFGAVVLSLPLVATYIQTGLVPRVPTAILVSGLVVVSFLFFLGGLILDTVTRGRRENKRMHYLAYRIPTWANHPYQDPGCPSSGIEVSFENHERK